MPLREGDPTTLFIITIVMYTLSVVIVCLRTYSRLSIRAFSTDDLLMIVGEVSCSVYHALQRDDWLTPSELLFTAGVVCMLLLCFQGVGTPGALLTAKDMVDVKRVGLISSTCLSCTDLNFSQTWSVFEQVYISSLIFIKSSICVTLLRIAYDKWSRRALYFILFLVDVSGSIVLISLYCICKPYQASWLYPSIGKCAPDHVLVSIAAFISATAIISDFSCSIIPSIILWRLQMRIGLKITVLGILSLAFLSVRLLPFYAS